MTITPVTSSDISAAILKVKAGDTLALSGLFPDPLPLKTRPADLTLDCTLATISSDSRTVDVQGMTFLGGVWTGVNPINITRGRDIRIIDAVMSGPAERLGNAMSFVGIKGLTVLGTAVSSYKNGMSLGSIDTFEVGNCGFEGMRADAIQGAPMWNGRFHGLRVHGTRPSEGAHCDGVQLRCVAGQPGTANIVVEDCEFMGPIQGYVQTHKSTDPRFSNITVRRVRASVSMPIGIGLLATDGATLEDCHVSTYPHADYQSRIYVAPDCLDVKWVVGKPSSYEAYRNKLGWTSA